jgi:hypothetical protein
MVLRQRAIHLAIDTATLKGEATPSPIQPLPYADSFRIQLSSSPLDLDERIYSMLMGPSGGARSELWTTSRGLRRVRCIRQVRRILTMMHLLAADADRGIGPQDQEKSVESCPLRRHLGR